MFCRETNRKQYLNIILTSSRVESKQEKNAREMERNKRKYFAHRYFKENAPSSKLFIMNQQYRKQHLYCYVAASFSTFSFNVYFSLMTIKWICFHPHFYSSRLSRPGRMWLIKRILWCMTNLVLPTLDIRIKINNSWLSLERTKFFLFPIISSNSTRAFSFCRWSGS